MRRELTHTIATKTLDADSIQRHRQTIGERVLSLSPNLGSPNFSRLAASDLAHLFKAYDDTFLNGECRRLLNAHETPLTFRLSPRMTSAGGKTIMETHSSDVANLNQTRFEIVISTTLLFETFKPPFREAKVVGCACSTRMDALQRIFEHELVHLIEMLLWSDSSCAQRRFRQIAWRLFSHRESNHQLITPTETAKYKLGIRTGDQVRFSVDDREYVGFVNRITKRATVFGTRRQGHPLFRRRTLRQVLRAANASAPRITIGYANKEHGWPRLAIRLMRPQPCQATGGKPIGNDGTLPLISSAHKKTHGR